MSSEFAEKCEPSSSVPPPHHDFEIPLGDTFPAFRSLETAVCTHGLFIMAPNTWDPHTNSLLRPLRLSLPSSSATVRISHRPESSSLLVRVYGVASLAPADRAAVELQVRRMLRLSEVEERKVSEFQAVHLEAKETGFGRVFRSPTLFEDMVKAILFCNCQWPRTLSMAKALCDLQLELQSRSSEALLSAPSDANSEAAAHKIESFTPATPAVKESRRKRKIQSISNRETGDAVLDVEGDFDTRSRSLDSGQTIEVKENHLRSSGSSNRDENVDEPTTHSVTANVTLDTSPLQLTGNFPSPEEIASLDEKYLAKRCGLGYRAGRILKLAQGVVEGRIQLRQLEELSAEASLSNYDKLNEMLTQIEGYGPFTRGNVLMCMGFYNVVPSDSETIRHLKQVHARVTTVQNVQTVVEEMYRRYEPYQFLAYWWELWSFYEGWFGKFSEMPSSDYKLITASKMKPNRGKVKDSESCRSRNS